MQKRVILEEGGVWFPGYMDVGVIAKIEEFGEFVLDTVGVPG